MLAVRLAERGIASSLINRTPEFGPGVAYATPFDGHLLNVRAGRMSAVEDRPDDFIDWLSRHHPGHADAAGFVPRRLFGHYVQDRLAAAEAAHPGRIDRVVGEAVAIESDGVRLADGRVVPARAVVLATGNPAPRMAADDSSGDRVLGDPWVAGVLARIGADDDVLIVGSGLTMVDLLLQLTAGAAAPRPCRGAACCPGPTGSIMRCRRTPPPAWSRDRRRGDWATDDGWPGRTDGGP